jgi:hypothetical protein
MCPRRGEVKGPSDVLAARDELSNKKRNDIDGDEHWRTSSTTPEVLVNDYRHRWNVTRLVHVILVAVRRVPQAIIHIEVRSWIVNHQCVKAT